MIDPRLGVGPGSLLELVLFLALLALVSWWTGGRPLLLLTILSFFVRALIGEALFVISVLRLPLFASLQYAEGFWMMGPDAKPYHDTAVALLAGTFDGTYQPGVNFSEILVGVYALFGAGVP